jgi:hypothetical protein
LLLRGVLLGAFAALLSSGALACDFRRRTDEPLVGRERERRRVAEDAVRRPLLQSRGQHSRRGNGEHRKLGSAYTGYDWQKFAPTIADWAAATRRRLSEWGFNSAGGWSLPPQELRLPTVINLELGRLAKFPGSTRSLPTPKLG